MNTNVKRDRMDFDICAFNAWKLFFFLNDNAIDLNCIFEIKSRLRCMARHDPTYLKRACNNIELSSEKKSLSGGVGRVG